MRRAEFWSAVACVAIILLVGFTATAIMLMRLSAPHEVHDFRVSLVRLNSAIGQGLTNSKYSDLVLDARVNFELARPELTASGKITACETAVVAAEQGAAVWQATLEKKLPESAFEPMHALGIIERDRFDAIVQSDSRVADIPVTSPMWDSVQELRNELRRQIVSEMLTRVSFLIGESVGVINETAAKTGKPKH